MAERLSNKEYAYEIISTEAKMIKSERNVQTTIIWLKEAIELLEGSE